MMIGGNNSATTISNKSTSAGGTVNLWKNSSKLMRDPDQIGNQMMNGNKLGTNNSSSIFGANGLININGSAAGSSSNAKQMQQIAALESQSNHLYGLPNFSPLKQNSETGFNGSAVSGKPSKITSAFSGQNLVGANLQQAENYNLYGSHQQIILNPNQ